jgi:hypothetical protein
LLKIIFEINNFASALKFKAIEEKAQSALLNETENNNNKHEIEIERIEPIVNK